MQLGTFENGVLTINEGVESLEAHSITGYDGLKKIVFPSTLKEVAMETVIDQEELEEVDLSKVTQLKVLPGGFIDCENKLKRFVIPYGVETVGNWFAGDCPLLEELYVPHTVRSIVEINGHKENTIDAYVFSSCPSLSLEDAIEDIRNLYVLPDNLSMYEEHLEYLVDELDIGMDDVTLKEMPKELRTFFGAEAGKELNWEEEEEPEEEDDEEKIKKIWKNAEIWYKEHRRVKRGRLKRKIGFWGALIIAIGFGIADFFFLDNSSDWISFLLFMAVACPVVLLWLWAWGCFEHDILID